MARTMVRMVPSHQYRMEMFGKVPGTIRIATFLQLFEPGTTTLVKQLLRPGMVFVDVGAHRGYYTLLASKLVGEEGRVFAFEPEPENFALLMKNLKGKKNVSIIQKAVGNKVGTTRLFLSPPSAHRSLDHSLFNPHGDWRSIEVEVTGLDEFFKDKDRNYKIDLIKMDIQGAEMSALEGMNDIVRGNPNLKIITEFEPKLLQRANCSPISFLNKLAEYDFSLSIINERKGDLESATIDSIVDLPQVNLYCEKVSGYASKT